MEDQFVAKSRLFRESYFPGGIIRLRNNSYAKVEGVRNNSVGLINVDETQLLNVVEKYVLEWENWIGAEVDQGLKYALSTKSLLVQSPSGIYVSPFPLLLKCNKCNVLDFYNMRATNDQQIKAMHKRFTRKGTGARIKCKISSCDGHMIQIPYLSVHRCGSVSAINMPPQTFRIPDVTFLDRGGSFFGSAFGNLRTNERVATALSLPCPSCSTRFPGFSEIAQRGTPITGGESFYPHTVQFISLSQMDGTLLSDISSFFHDGPPFTGMALDFAEGIVAGLIRDVPISSLRKQFSKMLHEGSADKDDIESIEEDLKKKKDAYEIYSATPTLPAVETILESLKKEIDLLEGQLAEARGLFKGVRNFLNSDELICRLANERRTQESVFFRSAFSEYTIKERIQNESDTFIREKLTQNWSDIKSTYGIDDITHISNLNVVLASLGYTREKRMPNADNASVAPLSLCPFEDNVDDSLLGKSVVYAMSAETEGLLIRLDPRKILRWCQDQFGWAIPNQGLLTDRAAAHAHLLETCPALTLSPTEVMRETKLLPLVKSAPFQLLHTISHCLLAVAKRHTGYDEKSLAEYLLPMDLSFLIYVTSVQNYTAGGLLTLFKHYLKPWMDDASNFAFQCIFDPICSDQGCTCSGCVQTVLGCETFNRGLSRAYLHGGEAIDDTKSLIIKKGFWHG